VGSRKLKIGILSFDESGSHVGARSWIRFAIARLLRGVRIWSTTEIRHDSIGPSACCGLCDLLSSGTHPNLPACIFARGRVFSLSTSRAYHTTHEPVTPPALHREEGYATAVYRKRAYGNDTAARLVGGQVTFFRSIVPTHHPKSEVTLLCSQFAHHRDEVHSKGSGNRSSGSGVSDSNMMLLFWYWWIHGQAHISRGRRQ
jgi:hypothetical protein